MSHDCRMMVPVFVDVQRRHLKVWAFLGWRKVPVDVNYCAAPIVLDEPQNKCRQDATPKRARRPPVKFSDDRYELAVPVMAEVYVSRLLDRDEFRQHCDHHESREAILANLH